jgi:hypothetical protein
MTALAANQPVALLRDAKGVYGVGVVGSLRHKDYWSGSPDLILRPDRVSESIAPNSAFECYAALHARYAALQMITGGFRGGPFQHTLEEELRRAIHHELLHRKGLPWSPEEFWGQLEPGRRLKNRQMYHGLRLRSLIVINGLISEALETAANPKAVTLARLFRMRERYSIYCATAQSHRALQLTETFPALGVAIYRGYWAGGPGARASVGLVPEARRLVEAGAPLRTVARLMRIPMAFRRVKPGAADLALSAVGACEDPRLVDAYLPDSLPMMTLWLRCLELAGPVGPDFVEWTARHATEIAGTPQETLSILTDLADWVRACHRASAPSHGRGNVVGDQEAFRPGDEGEQFVVRPFRANMSLATVTSLSHDWHEAVATNMSGPRYEFPEPWCPAGRSGELDIIPITTSAELYREGNLLHHCVGSYQGRVHDGDSYIYSVRRGDLRVATLELHRRAKGIVIGEVRGACNVLPPKQVVRAVERWVGSQREFRFAPKLPFVGERPERVKAIADRPERVKAIAGRPEGFPGTAQQLEFDFTS